MKRLFPFLLTAVILSGCSVEEKLSSKSTARDIKLKRLTIRQIDSLTADANYRFSIQNKVKNKENKNPAAG